MFDRLKRALKRKSIVNQDGSEWHVGQSRGGCYGLCSNTDGSYDNLFPDVSRIAEQIATILPYAIDAQGKRLDPQPQGIKALYNPNKEMSGPEFFETLATLALIHPTVYILAHRIDGGVGEITPENIGGFTFLQGVTPRYYADGTVQYNLNGRVVDDSRVLAISLNVNPYDLLYGYSPALAANKWATLDDYIVDWQSGTFKNNAIPAGEFIITARNAEEFNAIVDEMERKHKGAGRNNNVSYVHRPTSSIDGKPLPAQIEWVPFAQSAKDLTLDSVFDQANKKTAMAFGVPEEIKGFVQNSNYASVTTAERIFDKYTVLPKATKIWAKFTHELNRITRGLGYAITFDYEPAQLADEDKVNAETMKIQLETLRSALDAGFELDSIVTALELPDSFKTLNMRPGTQEETRSDVVETFKPEASQVETSTKGIKKAKCKTIASDDETEMLLQGYTLEQIEAGIADDEFDIEKKSRSLAKDLLKVLQSGAVLYALSQEKELETQASSKGYDVSDVTNYEPTQEFTDSYLEYLEKVALSFTEDTAESIRTVLERGYVEGWTKLEINDALRDIIPNEFWRIRRLQRTESHRSSQLASIDMAKRFAAETGIDGITKVWHINPASLNHCETCLALDGVELPLDESFEAESDKPFSAGVAQAADCHPNCECSLTFNIPDMPRVELEIAEEKTVKVKCPKCKRYICDAEKSAKLKNVVCARCGHHFDKEGSE